jgi:stage II sporulation protein P
VSNRKNKNIEEFSGMFTSICMFFITFVIFIILFNQAMGYSSKNGLQRNMFYVNIINLSMPQVKITCFNEEDMAENQVSLKKVISEILGINIDEPYTIIHREMAALNLAPYNGIGNDLAKANDNNFSNAQNNDTSFKLDNEFIQKAEETQTPSVDGSSSVFNQALVKEISTIPEVLIYHTHTSENYNPNQANSTDQTTNVCAVGEALKEELEKYGISTIHDTTVHDRDVYTKSYERSSVTLHKYLEQYGDFKLIIDIHRDAITDKSAITANFNGENVSKIMFVMAKKNPHFEANMENVNNLIDISNKLYPGFCNGIFYYNYGSLYFNQDCSTNALLIEVGSYVNTTEESKNSAKYIARIIAEKLNGKNE